MKPVLLVAVSVGLLLTEVRVIPNKALASCPSFRLQPTDSPGERPFLKASECLEADKIIDSPTRVYRYAVQVVDWMKSDLGFTVSGPIEVSICPDFGRERLDGEKRDPSTLGAFIRESTGGTIQVQAGLTARRLVQVVAHEWVHAWQSENCPEDQRLLIHEGLAQWGVAQLLKYLSLSEDLRTLTHREDFYGDAYRWVAALEEKKGREALLNSVRVMR